MTSDRFKSHGKKKDDERLEYMLKNYRLPEPGEVYSVVEKGDQSFIQVERVGKYTATYHRQDGAVEEEFLFELFVECKAVKVDVPWSVLDHSKKK